MAGNQHQPDPRQSLFLKAYLDPKSPTFSNIYKSALSVGYSEEYATNMNSQVDWLSESIRDTYLVDKAESNLKDFLEIDKKEEPQLQKIKADITKFVADRLGKAKWSESKTVKIESNFDQDQAKAIINALE